MIGTVRRVVVVGGGSAGWLTACVLAADHGAPRGRKLQVTVLESPEVPPIGVGEGTWPTMRDTLRRIGLSEAALVREADAAFKQGSRFDGWLDGTPGDRYFHPFVLPQGYTEADLAAAWLAGSTPRPFAEHVSVQPLLCLQGRAPKQASTPEFAAVANYGYHFDASKFGLLLRQHGVGRLGVHHVADHMVGVRSHDNGDLAAVRTRQHGEIEGDLFVDCTGLASRLLGEHFAVPWVSVQSVLFNDSALALQVPYDSADAPIASSTVATAQSHGWIWDIGLPTRRGVGHVYSSAHASDEAIEEALRRHVQATGGPKDLPAARKLSFRPGHRQRFWHRNCVAVGLAAGFVEPLEASAIALVELSAAMLSEDLPATRDAMDIVARRFNEGFGHRWERIVDFLKLHYALTRRRDTDYWRDHADPASSSQRLQDLLTLWRHRPPSRHDFTRAEELFPSASWQYVLYGMGFRPEPGAYAAPRDPALAHGFAQEAATLARRMAAALPGHRELVEHVRRHGMLRV